MIPPIGPEGKPLDAVSVATEPRYRKISQIAKMTANTPTATIAIFK